ncbi:MAG: class I SAM-dependent methyltransferase [Candidatus Omnitrophica bacterium]|nr:class I SAM-dependent methyltransferase [Candidatus Omnitrophota bacterium]
MTDNYQNITSETKKAWELNWSNIEQREITEIFNYPRVKKQIEIYLTYLPKNGLVLEAGCGLGQWARYLSDRGYKMIGIDYNYKTIEKAKNFNQDLPLGVADVSKLPFLDKSITAYLSFGVIEHFIEGPDASLQEAYRVLEEKGIAIITVPHKSIFIILKSPLVAIKRSAVLRRIFFKKNKAYYYQRYFTRKELTDKFNSLGFRIVSYKPIDHIFSLVEFSGIFRDKKTYDGENALAVKIGNFLERAFPLLCAGSNLFVLQKNDN